ncbi:MAG TPA: Ldh family oxidoreductase [Verrucomicrobiales bacterium]|nr:Ldh family oxidoreductase [Verrucomicrobiales bacterium]
MDRVMGMYVIDPRQHHALVQAAFLKRGFAQDEAADAARICDLTARHGIRTHNAIKALHLDEQLGSGSGGCVPGAEVERLPSRFPASEVWDAHRKFGPSVAFRAMERSIELAGAYGIGQVAVDNAFHYLWGGGYVMEAAQRGFIAYTNCTAALAEVVPHGGTYPTLGTNPHSWAFPTVEAIGYPIVVDWATSVTAMGRVQQFKREGKTLPPGSAVDAQGRETTDPSAVVALLPFGQHKGYGLALLNELYSAVTGGSLPTLRCKPDASPGEKTAPTFYFQVIHPEAIDAGRHAGGRDRTENLLAVIRDVLGHGNEAALLPGQLEAEAAARSDRVGGFIFTEAEIAEFRELARSCGLPDWTEEDLKPCD